MNDRDYRHFFIIPTCAKMIKDKELRSFFDYLNSGKAENEFTRKLKSYVEDAKKNSQWRMQYMTLQRLKNYAFDEGKKAGLEAGVQQQAIATAKKMLIKKYPIADISEMTGLSVESIQNLKK